MFLRTHQVRNWSAAAVAACLFASAPVDAQVLNLGGSGGVPNVGGGGGVSNVQNQINNVRGTARNGAAQLQQKTNNVTNRASDAVKNGSRAARNAQQKAASTAGRFQSPANGSANFNENLPVRLNGQTIQGLGQQGSLGFNVDTTGRNLKVKNVETGSLAASAGLRADDEILAVNRSWVSSTDQFRNDLSNSLQSQGRAWVMVRRNGSEQWLNIDADGAARSAMGASYSVNNGQLQVTNVFDGFAAADAGLAVGDRIVSINGEKISSRADFLSQINSNAGSAVDIVVDRDGATEQLSATLGSAKNSVASMSQQRLENTQQRVGQTAANTQAIASQRRDQVTQRTQSLADRVKRVGKTQAGTLTQRFNAVNQRVKALQRSVSNNAVNTKAKSAAMLRGAADQANELRAELESLRAEATAEAQSELTVAANEAAEIQATYSAMAMAEAEDQSEFLLQTQSRAQESGQQLMTAIGQVSGDVTEEAAMQRDKARQSAQELSNDLQNVKEAQTDRVAGLRERAATVQTRLLIAARNAQGLTRTQLANAAGRAAALRGRLNDVVATKRQQANETAGNALSSTRERLNATTQTLTSTADSVTGAAREKVQAARTKLQSANEMIAEKRGEAVADVAEKRAQAVSRLAEARQDLVEAAAEAPEDAQSELIEQVAKVETVADDLNMAFTSVMPSADVSVQQTSLGVDASTVAGHLRVDAVQENSFAARVGLQDGDEVMTVNGQNVATEAELLDRLKVAAEAGQSATLSIRRDDAEQKLTLPADEISLTKAN